MKLFGGFILAHSRTENHSVSAALVSIAETKKEALDRLRLICLNKYPISEGYIRHHVELAEATPEQIQVAYLEILKSNAR